MKRQTILVLAILLVASLAPVCKAVPLEWVRQSDSPVLDTGGPSPYESYHVSHPSVLLQDGIYKMWYDGYRAGPSPRMGICYATSLDKGLTWTKHGTVLEVTEEWERNSPPQTYNYINYPTVVYDEGMYKMWYNTTGTSVGYATSTDGINWDNKTQQLGHGHYYAEVVKGPSDYKLYYTNNNVIYCLQSDDGGVIDPWEITNGGNPILTPGGAGEWDDLDVGVANVRYEPQICKFQMWYSGDSTTGAPCIGFALSDDGLTWEKDINNPVLEPVPGTWESDVVIPGSVVFDSSDCMYRMFYGGYHHDHWAIGLAAAVAEPVEVEMVLIPSGEFEMGDHFAENNADERPVHLVKLDSFYMSRHEITNQQYCDFLNAADVKVVSGIVYASSDTSNSEPYCDTTTSSSYSRITWSGSSFGVVSGKEDHPMVRVSWYGAKAYCDYYGYRLPTEAEWEYAARGGNHNPYYRFPWGDTISHSQANYWAYPSVYEYDMNPTDGYHPDWDDDEPYTSVVGSFADNGYGLHDMTGNVWEWCDDWYSSTYYSTNPYDNPQGPANGTHRVLRGGSWGHNTAHMRVSDRYGNDPTAIPTNRTRLNGFRVARSADVEMEWVTISDPGFTGQMSKYETTNAQYCQFLNAALASGDITVTNGVVYGADGSNGGADFVDQVYYDLAGSGFTYDGATNGGAARINYSGGIFSVDGGFDSHPVSHVSWYGATAFCNYYGYRLPTEWEWQAVADHEGEFNYGCGANISNSIANYYNSTHPEGTTIVGSFGTYGYGMCDMAGNVWEWTSSIHSGISPVLRGGSWSYNVFNCLVSTRHYFVPYCLDYCSGFRVARDVEPVEVEMVLIPGGEFEMGDHHDGMSTALPIHSVHVDSFYMSKYEITNQQYCDYLNSALSQGLIEVRSNIVYAAPGGTDPYCNTQESDPDSRIFFSSSTFTVVTGKENHPMVEVSWYGAKAFCDYYGYRLPTEAEWEYAGRGGEHSPYYRFPWGDTIDGSKANYLSSGDPYEGTSPETTPVGYYDGNQIPAGSDMANGYGLCDMIGNVWEWCNDWYDLDYYSVSPYENPQGPASGTYRVLRGSSWGNDTYDRRVAYRESTGPHGRGYRTGFRVARDLEPCWQEQDKLTASDGAAGDRFGESVSVSGDYAIVGAFLDDDNGTDSGSAYIFKHNGTSWTEQAKLTASDGTAYDYFGYSVSISGDYAIVGAYYDDDNGTDSGSAYIFKRSDIPGDANWYQQAKLTASDAAPGDWFGVSVSVSGDYAIVGACFGDDNATDSGSAYIFTPNDVNPNNWDQIAKLAASDATAGDRFGYSVSVSGDTAIVGAHQDDDNGYQSGSAYIFTPNDVNPNNWDQIAKLTASDGEALDYFGFSVSVSGDYAIVGAYSDDDNGSNSGSAYIFTPNDVNPNNWDQIAKLTASDAAAIDYFGHSVSVSNDYAIVGAFGDDDNGDKSGSAYIFKWDGTSWVEQQKLAASDGVANDYFGVSVSISGDSAIVGTHGDDDAGSDSGSAYIFENVCQPPNTEPSANAGDDQTVDTGPGGEADVILDCSDSNDPDGDELTYTWFLNGEQIATGCNPIIELPCGTYIIVLIVNDGAVDSEPDYVEITVLDGTPPVINCPDDITLECPADTDPCTTGEATATDDCDPVPTITYSDLISGTCPKVIMRTWTATDASGNSSSCAQTITVQDTTTPVFTVVPTNMTVERDGNGNVAELDAWLASIVEAADGCGAVNVTNDFTSFPYECGNTGSVTVTWTATDECGNSTTTSATFTINDTTAGVTYDGDLLLSTAGAATVDTKLVATLRDDVGNLLDIDGEEVTFTLTAEGVGTIVETTASVNGVANVVIPLEPAIYMIKVTLDCSDFTSSAILVVFNPEGGFATGGGWIVPEPDGLNTYPNVRANFGFNAKYKQDDPTGHLEFRYSDGYIDLKSSSIEQLVITGGKIAQFKGWASVNGEAGHWFFVKAIDNGEPGTNDTFEIKIWNPGSNIDGDYDNLAGGILQGGNILVHAKD